MTLSTYSRLAVVATFLLIIAGGLVTSTGSGLAVPDWPLSYGMLFPPMVGGILYEHGHRMVAGAVAILTAILGIWLWRAETRRWVRRLGLVAVVAVLLQALLGGLTVLFLLPLPISVAHACLGQTFFCLVVAIAVAMSPGWRAAAGRAADSEAGGSAGDSSAAADEPRRPGADAVFPLAVATTGAIYLQLVIGALMRHTKAALAIPDFPLALGRIVPPLDAPGVAIHFAHRVGALVVVALVVATAARVFRRRSDDERLASAATLLVGLVFLQAFLGAATVWSKAAIPVATAHVAVGALVLAASLVLSMRAGIARRGRRAARAAHADERTAARAAAGPDAWREPAGARADAPAGVRAGERGSWA